MSGRPTPVPGPGHPSFDLADEKRARKGGSPAVSLPPEPSAPTSPDASKAKPKPPRKRDRK